MQEDRKSINGIQYLRAYAAILVVINHFCNNGQYYFEALNFRIIGGFGVDIFFIISGFIMAYTLGEFNKETNKQSAISFMKKRILRIYPIYLIILVPFIFIYFLKSHFGISGINIPSLIGSLLILPSITNDENYHMINSPAWTLVYEMFFYITLSLTIFFSTNKKKSLINYSILLIITLIIVNVFNLQGKRLGWVNLHYIIGDTLLLDFILGFIIYFIKKKDIKMNIPKPMLLILLIGATSLSMYFANKGYPRFISYGLTAFLVVTAFTISNSINNTTNKTLLFLGAASYSIYLSHPLLFSVHNVLSAHFSFFHQSYIFDIAFVILAIALGSIIHKKIEVVIEKKIKLEMTKKRTAAN